ncbi:sulfate ABC transporter substrate-binding protein [Trichocoleus sp. DQ-A3]|uniref:sulfate ABC transporter substrate-binding protein n=1 Tax=Cyanophyceae TaxID=3028117 RepID=UPI001686E01A|nr:sulfate ABC transporter substrate-binding protein [Coleofasciculus sp. FACHB-125]MBD1903393.1 sulfate ABC transporter substrate-binding protein [Coleofasciculus sp. FACHB-125]
MSKWQYTPKQGMQALAQVQHYLVNALQAIGQWCQQPIRSWWKGRSLWRFVSVFLVGVGLSMAIAACGSNANSASKGGDVKLSLVSYSVTQAAYEKIVPKFVEKWQKEHNQNVTIEQSYGGSGSQARAVIDGSQEADIVHLSLALDTHKIEEAGLIEPGWERKSPRGGIVTRSVVAIVTRPGNPRGINTWEDLTKDGLSIITANPKTSGIAIWNFLALWGSVTQKGGDEAQAREFATKVYKNVPVLTNNARQASDIFFKQGKGDVLLNYEDEVILAQQNGEKLPSVVPDVNISIDNPVALVDRNVDKHGTRQIAQAFVDFLYTTEAQQEFAKLGYRPVNPSVVAEVAQNYPQLKTLFTVQDLGGWDDVQKKFFAEGAIFDQIQVAGKI